MSDRAFSLGPQEHRRLDLACVPVRAAFGATPYLVGSVMTRRDYRDVDVRLISDAVQVKDRLALNLIVSEYLRAATDMPIDFQVQTTAEAAKFEGPRNPLGVRWFGVLLDDEGPQQMSTTIATIEDAAALPVRSVVVCAEGGLDEAWQQIADGVWAGTDPESGTLTTEDLMRDMDSGEIVPVELVYRPDVEAGR